MHFGAMLHGTDQYRAPDNRGSSIITRRDRLCASCKKWRELEPGSGRLAPPATGHCVGGASYLTIFYNATNKQ